MGPRSIFRLFLWVQSLFEPCLYIRKPPSIDEGNMIASSIPVMNSMVKFVCEWSKQILKALVSQRPTKTTDPPT